MLYLKAKGEYIKCITNLVNLPGLMDMFRNGFKNEIKRQIQWTINPIKMVDPTYRIIPNKRKIAICTDNNETK